MFFSDRFQTVLAFEPNPSTVYLLQFNTSLLPNVKVFNFGLGNEEGSFKMSESLSNKGANSICLSRPNQALIDIQVKKLDGIPLTANDISMMKIDVEGFEYMVLMGGENTIKKHQPLVLLEQLENEFNGNFNQSIEFLKDLDYKFCWQVRGIDTSTFLPKAFVNLLEIIRGRHQMIVTSRDIPRGNYPMLIAVPKRFQKILGITT